MLVIPMCDDTGEVQSLQLISGDGDKKFLSGGKMRGCYFLLGITDGSDTILIAEGYATAATLFEATGLPVVVAYNAGNLLPVAQSIRKQNPSASIILCADDDIKTKGNPGLSKATEAAHAVNGKMVVPEFGNNRPDDATDFNDMAAHLGKDAVARFLFDNLNEGNNTMLALASSNSTNNPDVPHAMQPEMPEEQPAFISAPKKANHPYLF